MLSILHAFLDRVLEVYMWIIIISALISWVNPDPYNTIVRFLHLATDPVLRPIRRRIGMYSGIDISPIIVIFLIYIIRVILGEILPGKSY